MELIPAIDLLGGRAVRLLRGDYDAVTVYSEDPAALAESFRAARRLHVVDLEGARAGRAVQRELVQAIVERFGAGVQVGGGVRSLAAVDSYLDLGVERVVLGTAAIRDPELVAQAAEKHPGRVVIALDARAGMVATDGWLDVSETRAVELARQLAHLPLAGALYTDIERDGTEAGPNVAETARLAREGGIPVIASGGVGNLEHLAALARARAPIAGAIVGRALLEHRFELDAALALLREVGEPGRSAGS